LKVPVFKAASYTTPNGRRVVGLKPVRPSALHTHHTHHTHDALGLKKKAKLSTASHGVSGVRAAGSASRRTKANAAVGKRPLLVALNALATALKQHLAATGGAIAFSGVGLEPFFVAFPEQRAACRTYRGLLAGVVAQAKSLVSVPPTADAPPGTAPTIQLVAMAPTTAIAA
jgi:hypothetical protein